MFNHTIVSITEKILKANNWSMSYEEACKLALMPIEHTMDLIICAEKIRTQFKKEDVFTCSIINAKSGRCSQDCAFCAQSSHHKTKIDTYPLISEEEILKQAFLMKKSGATNFSIVTSGYRLSDKDLDSVCHTASAIKNRTHMTVCASVGMLDTPAAELLKQSGISNYHHNLETARSYFEKVCTSHDYNEDIGTLEAARKAGLRVCSGGIMGLGETWEQRVELAWTLKELDVDSIPINFLNPVPGTKMEKRPLMQPLEALKCIALFRFINPTKDITICGGREVTLRDFQSWVFTAGANGLMVGNYLTTHGRDIKMDLEMIKALNLEARCWMSSRSET